MASRRNSAEALKLRPSAAKGKRDSNQPLSWVTSRKPAAAPIAVMISATKVSRHRLCTARGQSRAKKAPSRLKAEARTP